MVTLLDPDSTEETDLDPAFDADQERREVEQRAYREASEECMRLWNTGLAHIGGRLPMRPTTDDMRSVAVDFWAVAYAVGSWICKGVGVTQRAEMLGVERATLSAMMVKICVGNSWPPSQYMRDSETMTAYRLARIKAIETENARA